MRKPDKMMMARSIGCPKCNAKSGEPCVTEDGNKHGSNHKERFARYEVLTISKWWTTSAAIVYVTTLEDDPVKEWPRPIVSQLKHEYPKGALVELAHRERLWVLDHTDGRVTTNDGTRGNVGPTYTLGTLIQPLLYGVPGSQIVQRINIEGGDERNKYVEDIFKT